MPKTEKSKAEALFFDLSFFTNLIFPSSTEEMIQRNFLSRTKRKKVKAYIGKAES